LGFIPVLILLIVLGVFSFVFYSFFSFQRIRERAKKKNFGRVQPIYELLIKDSPVTKSDIYSYAQNPVTRELTYRLLYYFNKEFLFPSEFYTIEMGAESNLVNWLEFPTELNVFPDRVEYIKRVSIEEDHNNLFHYHVFQFSVNEPHFSAKHGWMIGVVGPYFEDSRPFDIPVATFSRLKKKSEVSPEEETIWVHDNICMREPNLTFLRKDN
jgi:hypothetical protein